VITDDHQDPGALLTAREIEVLELAAEGTGIAELGEELALSPDTVRTHLKNVYAKLGVHNRMGAVTRAMRLGLIEPLDVPLGDRDQARNQDGGAKPGTDRRRTS
jgi:ATP/maltotriose-dependent transcriptional regulator MalT